MADRNFNRNRDFNNRGFTGEDWEYDQGYSSSEYYGRGSSGNRDFGNRDYGNRGSRFNRSYGTGYGTGSSDYGEGYYGSDWNPGSYDEYGASSSGYGSGYGSGFNRDWRATSYYIPGPFFGQGPRGYQRSDERILDDAATRLTFDGRIDAANINLTVNNAEVTLDGAVGTRQQKRFAEDDIEMIPGVKDIHNHLHVDPNLRQQGWQGQQQGWQSQQQGWQGQQQGQQQTGFQGGRFTEGPLGQNFKSQLHEGLDVLSADGQKLGTIKDIRSNEFTLNRAMHPDLLIPFSSIRNVTNQQVHLSVPANQIDSQGWPTTETSGQTRTRS